MNIAVILSGGTGSRMRTDGFPKQYIEVNGKPILLYTLEKFDTCPCIDKIIVVADVNWHNAITQWTQQSKLEKFAGFALPGSSRQESIFHGLQACMALSQKDDDCVIIHDGVRPLVSHSLIEACFRELDTYDGCMPVLAVTDTVYYSEDSHTITSLLDRNKLFAGQSPEAFRLKKYYAINEAASPEELANIRGTTEIAYQNGHKISLIPGEYSNFKLTTPTDLDRFKAMLEASV